ncbi:ATP-binding cassette sub- A member 1 [Lunasporangiospora selenospora]|uniref:ATP-binding cassette sub- A member 1 n=1 Tax=Lunasporangiospora selenospora TaxID=979761 RepID=A0A9P6FW20_9FUNG|nr:ATP-binding cassette sub- A member 1 [Lunasporangiospora selenospora]
MSARYHRQADGPSGSRADYSPAITTATKPATSVIFASPRPSTPLGRWFRQLGVICRLNGILLIRYWKLAIIQAIILPLLVIGITFAIQKSDNSPGSIIAQEAARTWKLDGIHQCVAARNSNPCITLAYTPQNEETTAIMKHLQTKNTARTNKAISMVDNVWSSMENVPSSNMGIVPLPSEDFLYDYALRHPDTIRLGVAFTKEEAATPADPTRWSYLIYYNQTYATNTSVLPGFRYSAEAGSNRRSSADDPYGVELPNLVRAVDEALLTHLDPGYTQADFDIDLMSYPKAESRSDSSNGGSAAGMLSNLMALPACITMVTAMLRIAREKESKCKESMYMMGLHPMAYWVAQWLVAWIMALVQGSVMVAFGYAFKLDIFTNTDWFVHWLSFVLLTYGMTMLGFLLTVFCQRSGPTLALGFATVVAVLISLPIYAFQWNNFWIDLDTVNNDPRDDGTFIPPMTKNTWIVTLFVPFMHFARLWDNIGKLALGGFDYRTGKADPGPGFHFANLTNFKYQPSTDMALPQPSTALSFYPISFAILALLTLYLDQVIPNEYGRGRNIFFFFGSIGRAIRSLTQGGQAGIRDHQNAEAKKVIPYEGQPPETEDSDVIAERERAVNCQTDVAIRISNLTKIYTGAGGGFFKRLFVGLCCCCSRRRRNDVKATNTAVDRLNLVTESNELFALLGQNGAGKSTTMQMLYGVTSPTSGKAFLFNRSIRDNMADIRRAMGVCPQHDILFNDLSCWEHMQLYAGIKDLPAADLLASMNGESEKEPIKENMRPTWIRSRLEAVQLWKDRNTMAGNLSGGMKRRLSTIISTIGDPNVLILDEPTTGMDPIHRRHVWTFLAQFKRGRSILLTTHSMEEADALGDKVAIMVSGHLKAIGNTTRLKNKFGNGYRIELALGNFIPEDRSLNPSQPQNNNQVNWPSQKQLEQEMVESTRAIIPSSAMLDNSGGVMVFSVPIEDIEKMSELTAMLERAQSLGKIKQWGVAQTSLEEVFLSLIRSSDDRH